MSPSCKRGKPRLEHWLWRNLDSEACVGVRWVNKAQRTFKIPWINQKKSSEWREELSQLFVEYAKDKGKLQPGGRVDHPKFKQNFKSALGYLIKCKALKRLSNEDSKVCRFYKFDADYSSFNKREGGNDQQTRNQSHDTGGDISTDSEALDNVGTLPVFTEQPSPTSSDKREDTPGIDLLQDGCEKFLGHAEMACGFPSELLQGGSSFDKPESLSVSDENAMAGLVQDLHLSPNVDISVAENSQIQNTTVDSTTERFASDEQNLAASSQINLYDIIERENTTSTHMIHSNTSMAGCSLTIHTDAQSTPLVGAQLGDKTILDNLPRFLNRAREVQVNRVAVSLTTSQEQCYSSLSSSMETSEQQNNHDPEAALPISVSSSTSTETAIPQPLTPPGVQTENLMAIQIIYSSPQRVVMKAFITSNKCKIFFGSVNSKRLQKVLEERDNGAEPVKLPSVKDSDFDEASKTRIAKTLERMELGVVMSYRDHDIYVTRRCQSHVFLTDGTSTSVPVPRSRIKEPDQEIKAFDFAEFEKSVARFNQHKTGTVDRDHFMLTLGCEILQNDPNPTRVVPIRIDVQHWKAATLRYTTLGPSAYAPDPKHSMSDSFDTQVHLSNFPMSTSD